jgi:hypothetical protein
MKYEIAKLDHRHNHRNRYCYMIKFRSDSLGTGALDFDQARRWFNETYGWAQEAELQVTMNKQSRARNAPLESNSYWAYQTEYRDYRIYVASDKEVSWFSLSHVRET